MAVKRKAPKRGHNLNGNTKIQNPTALTAEKRLKAMQMLWSGAYTRREIAESVGAYINSINPLIDWLKKSDEYEVFEYLDICSVTGSPAKRVTLDNTLLPVDAGRNYLKPINNPTNCLVRQVSIFDYLPEPTVGGTKQ